MKVDTALFKTISPKLMSQLKPHLHREYYYIKDNDQNEINENIIGNDKEVELVDDTFSWDFKNDSLYLNISLELDNCDLLFASNGVCFEDAILGVGLSWKSDKSRLNNSVKLGEITSLDKKIVIQKNDILIKSLNSNTSFKLFFYISKYGSKNGQLFFANEIGLVLYRETFWTIIIEGSGSTFPVRDVYEDNAPLWNITVSFDDITTDLFNEDYVSININKSHKAYPLLNPTNKDSFNKDFLNEVMSSAVVMLILEIRKEASDKDQFDFDQAFESGSILQAISFFKNKLKFAVNDDYDKLLKSVKSYFDKEF